MSIYYPVDKNGYDFSNNDPNDLKFLQVYILIYTKTKTNKK